MSQAGAGKAAKKNDNDQWVFLMPDTLMKKLNEDNTEICRLRHPRTGCAAMYVFSEENKKFHEITQYKEDVKSWFIDQSVQRDGSLYLVTAMDPVLLMLPYLIKAGQGNKFSPLDQILHDEEFPECSKLSSVKFLDFVCDSKGTDDLYVYRYNEVKTLTWLERKVKRLVSVLKEENIQVAPGYAVDTYVMSKKERVDEVYYVKYAYEIVCEYLTTALSERLKEHLGIEEIVAKIEGPENVNVNVTSPSEPPTKKPKLEGRTGEPTEDYSKQLKPLKSLTNRSVGQKKVEKIDKTGMRSITSFFSTKPKT